VRLTHRQEEELLFEKRSKNFCLCGLRAVVTLALYKQEFFGSFFKKELLP
jgi:hypothetical protein